MRDWFYRILSTGGPEGGGWNRDKFWQNTENRNENLTNVGRNEVKIRMQRIQNRFPTKFEVQIRKSGPYHRILPGLQNTLKSCEKVGARELYYNDTNYQLSNYTERIIIPKTFERNTHTKQNRKLSVYTKMIYSYHFPFTLFFIFLFSNPYGTPKPCFQCH